MGLNFYLWIAIGIVVVSTIAANYGHDWVIWIGWPLAIALAIFAKIRAVRRRRPELRQEHD